MEAAQREEGGAVPAPRAAGETAASKPVPGQRLRRTWRSASEPQIDFPPVRNGLDYLVSVVSHLNENESEVTPRDVKYAVLHLEAAVELLLKARLHSEHWTLVFTDLQKVTPKALKESSFHTVGADKALDRLKTFVGVDITDKDKAAVDKLIKYRNRLQHFGFTENASAVENLAGEVLDFLIRFIDDQLLPGLQDEREKAEAEADLLSVRKGLTSIHSFVKERMNRLGGELRQEGAENRTVECPECEQLALVVGGGTAICRFCAGDWDPDELAGYFNNSGWEERGPWLECPACAEWTLGSGVRLRSDPDVTLAYFCFSCGNGFPEFVPCDGCSRPVQEQAGGGPTMCSGCWSSVDGEAERYGPDGDNPEDYGFDPDED